MGAKESRADIVGVPEKNRVWLLKHPKLQGRGFMYDFVRVASALRGAPARPREGLSRARLCINLTSSWMT